MDGEMEMELRSEGEGRSRKGLGRALGAREKPTIRRQKPGDMGWRQLMGGVREVWLLRADKHSFSACWLLGPSPREPVTGGGVTEGSGRPADLHDPHQALGILGEDG